MKFFACKTSFYVYNLANLFSIFLILFSFKKKGYIKYMHSLISRHDRESHSTGAKIAVRSTVAFSDRTVARPHRNSLFHKRYCRAYSFPFPKQR